jgi:hypothetical protein
MDRGPSSHVAGVLDRCLDFFLLNIFFHLAPSLEEDSSVSVYFLNIQLSQTCELEADWTGFPSVGAVQNFQPVLLCILVTLFSSSGHYI